MKILLAVSSMNAGGAERVAATLVNAWAARGDDVILVPTYSGGSGQSFYPLAAQVTVRWLTDLAPARSWLAPVHRLWTLRRVIQRENPDVVISFLTNVNVATLLATCGLAVPVIVCERTNPLADTTTAARWRRLRRWFYPRAAMVTVQAEETVAPFAQEVPGMRALVAIPNPLPLPLLDAPLASLTADQDGRRRIVAMGRMVADKQFGLLIDAFDRVAVQAPEWDLWIWGDGPQRQILQEQIARLGLHRRVFLPGRSNTPWQALAQGSVFALSSAVEGFPNVLLEAMALGLPSVVFDCPSGPREMTRDGQDALLVPLGQTQDLADALARLMADSNLRTELGQRAAASVRTRYALDAVLARWDDLFLRVGSGPHKFL